jgi:hypothetical protein
VTATECNQQTVIKQLQYAHIADSALNGMVLLGEGGRVQIAVLCSALGFGIGRCSCSHIRHPNHARTR